MSHPDRPSLPAADVGGPRCTAAILSPGAVGSALICRLALRHNAVRYAGDPVHEADGVAGLLVRWRYLEELTDDDPDDPAVQRRIRRYPQILEVVNAADTVPLVDFGPTGYRPPAARTARGSIPPPQLRLIA